MSKSPHSTNYAKQDYAKKSQDKQNSDKKPDKKPSLLWRVAKWSALATATTGAVTTLGVVGGWHYLKSDAKHRRQHLQGYHNEVSVQSYCGRIEKTPNGLTLVTDATSYHLHDPMAIIDDLAKEAGITQAPRQKVYHFDGCVMATISPKGHYGYLGHLPYQLTVVEPYSPQGEFYQS
ncbi:MULTISPECIES: hypothetical protein [unclassified Moraxella]|uniref:hypothetical protein n=1 Tax=unclassified Moraxella TaxID=2685852 RepID=UPI003AF6724A